jgi:hypothetical protein
MRMLRVTCGSAFNTILFALVTGCGTGPPTFVPPTLPASEVATLQGTTGIGIELIDGARVPEADGFANLSENKVVVAPGLHKFTILQGALGHTNVNQFRHFYTIHCEPGHSYELTPSSTFWHALSLRLTDKNTHESVVINDTPHGPTGLITIGQ